MAERKKSGRPEPLTNDFNGMSSDVVDKETGKTRLIAALEAGAPLHDIYQLLRLGAAPDKADNSGRKPMDVALERDWYAAADLLLMAGAEPPAYDGMPDGPLVYKPRGGTYYTNEADEMKRETPLTWYIKKTDFRQVYPIIANGADINKRNAQNETPLEAAVARGWPYMTRQIVRYGGWLNPEKPDPDEVVDEKTGATRLLLMIQEGEDGNAIQRIIDEEGADVNKPDRYGVTPLALARAMKWAWVEQLLLDRGADPNVTFPDPSQKVGKNNSNDTPMLVYATVYQNCHHAYFLGLLDAGADVNGADKDGRTAIWWASMHNHGWHFDHLKAKGADLLKADSNGAAPLQIASLNAQLPIVKRLLPALPPDAVNAVTVNNQTALYLAVTERKNAEKVCDLLLDNGADVTIATKGGDTALHQAARIFPAAFVRKLIARGADVNAATESGTTPINEAILGNKPENLKLLLEAGASIDKANQSKHYRPLYQTLGHNTKYGAEMARLLLEHGADPNMRCSKELNECERGTIFFQAMHAGKYDVAGELLKAGADVHGTASDGASAMHHCLSSGRPEGIRLLLDAGFDPLRIFQYKRSAFDADDRDDNPIRLGSAYDEALYLVRKHGDKREYKKMLAMIEEQLVQPAGINPGPAPAATPAPKRTAKPGP